MSKNISTKEAVLFSKNIKYLRMAYRLKQSDVVGLFSGGLNQGTLSNLESNKRGPSLEVLSSYATLFSLSEHELLEVDLSKETLD